MANHYRNESRRRPPLDKYGTPGTQYPTANPYDVVITEEVTNRAQVYEPVLYGTPHPVAPAAVLCYQGQIKGNNADKAPTRIYANPRLAQEPYNLVNGDDDANDAAFPVFVRSYLLPRGYTRATRGAALTALIGLKIVAPGSGYGASLETPGYGKVALSFSGGSGSGAAGLAEIAGGAVVAVVLTNTGSGYTSAPTVSLAGGSGASITALLQPSTARMTNEEEQAAEEPYGGYFVRVSRTWETIPGKILTTTKYDAESDVLISTSRQKKLLSDITPGVTNGGTVTHITEEEPIDALYGYEVITSIPESPYHSEDTALIEEEMLPAAFPGRINIRSIDLFGTSIGLKTPSSETVLHKRKSYWEISASKPVLTFDEITGDDLVLNDVPYKNVLHNDTTRVYNGTPIFLPETTPNFSDYTGVTEVQLDGSTTAPSGTPWIGSPRALRGSVTRAGNRYRWKVTITEVVMR